MEDFKVSTLHRFFYTGCAKQITLFVEPSFSQSTRWRHETLKNNWSKVTSAQLKKLQNFERPTGGLEGVPKEPAGLRDGKEFCQVRLGFKYIQTLTKSVNVSFDSDVV